MRIGLFALAAAATWFVSGCTTVTEVNGQPVASTTTAAEATEADATKRASIRLQLAASYYQKGQYNVALEEVKRALEADSGHAPAYGLLGLIYMDLGDRPLAESNFARALSLDSNNPELQNNYGWFLCQTGRERDAPTWFERAAKNRLYRTPALAMQNAGVCLMKVGDLKGAETFLRRAFELDAASPAIKYHLARLYVQQRQVDRAKFYYGLLERSVDATAATLWLGLRIARLDGDVRTEQQLADDLRRRFADSKEAAALRRGAFDE
ncbi:MAG TPA: type IV pilus biogenesis/stability protein PilW [Burkholderiaceae bacterium]|nr:type IV pilus biogenesis/stability protein PilW [Burkholderiaceae bacterium]